MDVTNGATLCKKCHKQYHKKYGTTKNVNRNTFLEFLQTVTGGVKHEKTIDWEQRRYELAKEAMNGILSNSRWDKVSDIGFFKS